MQTTSDTFDELTEFFPKKGGLGEARQRWDLCVNQAEILADAAKCPKVKQWTVSYWLHNKHGAPLPSRPMPVSAPQVTVAVSSTPVVATKSASFETVKAEWLKAGKYKTTENWEAAKKEFDKKITEAEFPKFIAGLKMAVSESKETERKFLGVLVTFIRDNKWKNYEAEVKEVSASLSDEDINYEIDRHNRVADLHDWCGPCPCWFCFNKQPIPTRVSNCSHVKEIKWLSCPFCTYQVSAKVGKYTYRVNKGVPGEYFWESVDGPSFAESKAKHLAYWTDETLQAERPCSCLDCINNQS